MVGPMGDGVVLECVVPFQEEFSVPVMIEILIEAFKGEVAQTEGGKVAFCCRRVDKTAVNKVTIPQSVRLR